MSRFFSCCDRKGGYFCLQDFGSHLTFWKLSSDLFLQRKLTDIWTRSFKSNLKTQPLVFFLLLSLSLSLSLLRSLSLSHFPLFSLLASFKNIFWWFKIAGMPIISLIPQLDHLGTKHKEAPTYMPWSCFLLTQHWWPPILAVVVVVSSGILLSNLQKRPFCFCSISDYFSFLCGHHGSALTWLTLEVNVSSYSLLPSFQYYALKQVP